jgi:hypothetical protein
MISGWWLVVWNIVAQAVWDSKQRGSKGKNLKSIYSILQLPRKQDLGEFNIDEPRRIGSKV